MTTHPSLLGLELGACLGTLNVLCRRMQADSAALRSENGELRRRIAAGGLSEQQQPRGEADADGGADADAKVDGNSVLGGGDVLGALATMADKAPECHELAPTATNGIATGDGATNSIAGDACGNGTTSSEAADLVPPLPLAFPELLPGFVPTSSDDGVATCLPQLAEPRRYEHLGGKLPKPAAFAASSFVSVDANSASPETLAEVRVHMFSRGTVSGYYGESEAAAEPHKNFGVKEFLAQTDDLIEKPMFFRIGNSWAFKSVCMAVIILNTFYIAWKADLDARNAFSVLARETVNTYEFVVYEWAFTVWFTFELVIRILAEQYDFFFGENMGWNIVDTFLVFNSIFDRIFPNLGRDFSYIRILRVFRLIRVVRVVKSMKALRSLRTMIFSLINSFVSLIWAFVMIYLTILIFGLIIMNGVESYVHSIVVDNIEADFEHAAKLKENFGTLYESMVSLFCAISGGNDWYGYAELLRPIHNGEFYFLIFAFYIAFCLIGMLNVVTGIFVDSAVLTRTDDEVVDAFKEDMKRTTANFKQIFMDADADHSGTISLEEFQNHVSTPWVKAYLSGLEIDPAEAVSIFTLIDTDGDNRVSLEEFVAGTMKLKGHAKSVDVLSLMYDSARHAQKFNMFCSYVEDQLKVIRAVLDPNFLERKQPRHFQHAKDIGPTISEMRAPGTKARLSCQEEIGETAKAKVAKALAAAKA